MNKPTSLTFHYFGKTVSVKNDTNVIHLRQIFNMFRSIVVSEFGEKEWENMILNLSDEILTNPKSKFLDCKF